jgi:L-cysteate sulfo-lyase
MDLDRFPIFPLAHKPTPLEPLERLSRHLAGPRLYIKRDDCTGLATGGNKTRKLEYLIGQALKDGATTIVSAGGLQSNHVRQTAAAAAKAGLTCHLVLDHRVPIDTEAYRSGGNFLLDRLLGATTHICKPGETRAGRTAQLLAELRAQGERPYDIPVGGSNALGALGYAAMMGELQGQAQDAGISLDRIVLASSSGGTLAGLLAGRALAGAETTVTGVDVDGDPDTLAQKVLAIARDCATSLGLGANAMPAAVELVRGYAAPGYGQPNAGMIEAVKLMATLEGILLDPVYTGKGMAGLIDLIRKDRIGKDETVVFVHTGGTPALSAYADRL